MQVFTRSYVNVLKSDILDITRRIGVVKSRNTVLVDLKEPVLSDTIIVAEDRANSLGH